MTHTPLSRDWLLWISENMLRDCSHASMLQTMLTAGVDAQAAAQGMQDVATSPMMQAARNHQQITHKLQSIMLNHCKLQQHDPKFSTIERRGRVTEQELLQDYYLANRPVIITDLASDWPALKKWTPDYFKAHFGDVEVEVQYGRGADPNYEQNKLTLRRKIRLADFVDDVQRAGSTNDMYMTANNEALKTGPLASLVHDIGALPGYLVPERLQQEAFLWFGPAGTVTPLHHDAVHLLHLQIVGRKRWRFISPMQTPYVYNYNQVFSQVNLEEPDLARHPLFAQATILDAVVEPGEAIFLPLAWWHHVRSLDTCISLSLSNLRLSNAFEYQNPSNAHW
jgi:Cupin-like domain